MITFKKIKAHFLMLCGRLKKTLLLALKYFLHHPLRLLMALVALIVLIAAIYAVEYFIAGQSFKKVKSPQVVQAQESEPSIIEPKKFAKNIKLSHAYPKTWISQKNKHDATNNIKSADTSKIDGPVKYPVWDLKQPLKKAAPVQKIEEEVVIVPEEQKEPEIVQENIVETPEVLRQDPIKIQNDEVEKKESLSTPESEDKVKELEEQAPALLLYRKVEGLGLNYLKTPILLEGEAVVYGANELYVKDTYLYLYGIYTDPIKYDDQEVTQYMRDLASGQNLQCLIVAYTADNVATGLCFLGDENLNQKLVDKNMADNIAL